MRTVEDVVMISPVYAFIYVAKSADGFMPESLWLPQAAERARINAARYGIDEESATGTSNAALTYYLWQHHLITIPFECHFIQGEAMGKPSIITTVLTEKDRYCEVVVGGRCYIREKKRWHYTKH